MQFALGAITVVSLLMVIAMGVVTWHIVRDERRRTQARLMALRTELERRGMSAVGDHETAGRTPIGRADLFEPSANPSVLWRTRLTALGVAGAVVVVGVSVAIFAVSDSGETAADSATVVPVELIALTHSQRDGLLEISGAVRNPPHSAAYRRLSVLAIALDDGGTPVAQGQEPVDGAILAAGDEASFTVNIPTRAASRYRISFLVDDTPIPHRDRRIRTTDPLVETTS